MDPVVRYASSVVVVSVRSHALEACLGGVWIGDGVEPRIMGAINVSPESFYGRSVAVGDDDVLAAAERMVAAGASLIDVGAMSTAPYLRGEISPIEEADRLQRAVGLLARRMGVPVSADTSRAEPARAALAAGAEVINDVTGLRADPGLADVVAQAGAGLIVTASPPRDVSPAGPPLATVSELLATGVQAATRAGVPAGAIAVDPGIGFFRGQDVAWPEWDCRILAGLGAVRAIGRPLCVGVSRKSFIGALAGCPDPADRLPGSLAATAAAVLAGAHLIRTHDVAETLQAVRVAWAIRRAGAEGVCR